jgi:CheY-like chemotaxis protein
MPSLLGDCVEAVSKEFVGNKLQHRQKVDDLYRHRILLVDDEPVLRYTVGMVMKKEGYDVSTAVDGYDALAQLRYIVPDIIISDLNMPRMSGFELLKIVRVRFPHIPLIAMSGAYDFDDYSSSGLIADAVFSKGICRLTELEQIVADLIRAAPARENLPARRAVPVQVPVFRNESGGALSIKLACTECLRTFSVEFEQEAQIYTLKAQCAFCAAPVHYVTHSFAAMLRKVFDAKEAVR